MQYAAIRCNTQGDVTFRALCGHYSAMVRADDQTSSFAESDATTTTAQVTTTTAETTTTAAATTTTQASTTTVAITTTAQATTTEADLEVTLDVVAEQVRTMLGLADRGRILDLFDLILRGDAAGALGELSGQYADGADPIAILRDLAEISHWISVIKITPGAADDPTASPDERNRGLLMADALPMRILTRIWQMLLSSLEEVARAPNSMMAAEMAVIRLTHVADLPTPDELIRKLNNTTTPPATNPKTVNLSAATTVLEPKPTQAETKNFVDQKMEISFLLLLYKSKQKTII